MNHRLIAGFLAFSTTCLQAAAPIVDAPPPDTGTIIQALKDLQDKQEQTRQSQISRATDQIFAAAASPSAAMAFYEDAIMATQFQGVTRENGQFREWKKKEEPRLKNRDFAEAVRMHLFWLGVTMRRAGGTQVAQLMPQMAGYLKLLDAAEDPLNAQGSLLRVSVNDGIFAKWLRLEPWLRGVEKWEMNPGNADGIATKILLPEWREEKSPAVFDYWDARITREAGRAGESKLDFRANDFNEVRKPLLLWRRAQEYLHLGLKNRAINEMFAVIKAWPTHPNVGEWIGSLEKLLTETSQTPPTP